MIKNKKYLPLFLVCSLAIHILVAGFLELKSTKTPTTSSVLKIRSIRQVGEDEGVDKNLVYLPQKIKSEKEKPNEKKLLTKQLAPDFAPLLAKSKKERNEKSTVSENGNRTKAIKSISLDNSTVTAFLKGTPNSNSAKEYLRAFDRTSSLVALEIPKGIKESELNKHELVFYSFQKRTAQTYINSFYNKLNEFKLKNPHLNFPISEKKEKMTGRVVYDENGNIVRINMLEWTNKEKLQDFFLEVLQEMYSLPNPPKMIIKDGQFTVFFSLTVNS
jgi:hypothetical protein